MAAKVLLIHENLKAREEFAQVFEACHMRLTAVSEGDALAQLRRDSFDLIFIDAVTSAALIETVEQAMAASALNREAGLILLGDDGEESVRAHLQGSEDTYVLYKPFDRVQMLGLLSACHAPAPRQTRRFKRITLRMQVHVDTQNEQFTALADSLSEGGMNVLVSGNVTMDTTWVVSFTLPGAFEPVEASGRVLRLNETSVSLSFQKIREEGRESIRSFVSAQALNCFSTAEHQALQSVLSAVSSAV